MTEEKIQQADVHLAAPGSLSALRAATVGAPLWGWKPIETAPKGRKVLVGYLNRANKWRTVVGCYYLPQTLEISDGFDDDAGFAPEGWYEESDSSEIIHFTDSPPTHWMPLPGAPTGQSRTFEAALAAPSYEARPDALAPAALLTPELSARIEDALECALLWSEGSEAHPRIERVLADFRAAEAPASVSQGMAQDAARYRAIKRALDSAEGRLMCLDNMHHPAIPANDDVIAILRDGLAALLPLPQPTGERG